MGCEPSNIRNHPREPKRPSFDSPIAPSETHRHTRAGGGRGAARVVRAGAAGGRVRRHHGARPHGPRRPPGAGAASGYPRAGEALRRGLGAGWARGVCLVGPPAACGLSHRSVCVHAQVGGDVQILVETGHTHTRALTRLDSNAVAFEVSPTDHPSPFRCPPEAPLLSLSRLSTALRLTG